MEYLFQGKLDNTVHDITYDQIQQMFEENLREREECRQVTFSSNRGETYYDGKHDMQMFYKEYLYRDPRTAGIRMYYPHGVVLTQSVRKSFFRGENQVYEKSQPTLFRSLDKYASVEEKELYRLVADMRIEEFTAFIRSFEHVKKWKCSDVLYDCLAQHYGLETPWLDITNDFNVAMFFATCTYDKKTASWRPLENADTETDDAHKYGMIFHMPSWQMSSRWMSGAHYFSSAAGYPEKNVKYDSSIKIDNLIYPIGFQPFMRCHMQEGYGIYMRKSCPLQSDIGFEKLRFRHNEKLSKAVFELMHGGKLIYPHEGLNQVSFIIDEIAGLTEFSEQSFEAALRRSQFYCLKDADSVKKRLEEFAVAGQKIKVLDGHKWYLSSSLKRKIDRIYRNFSVEETYGIKISERKRIPMPNALPEPWMIPESETFEGVQDFKLRDHISCGDSIVDRSMINTLATLVTKRPMDF